MAEPLRATLRMLGELTRTGRPGAEDMREVLAAGVSPGAAYDALAVCAAFTTTGRLADAFGFALLSPGATRPAVPAQAGLPEGRPENRLPNGEGASL